MTVANYIKESKECSCKRKEIFAIIRWQKDDLIEVFENNNIPFTEENYQRFLDSRGPKKLEEESTTQGHEILDVILSNIEFNKSPARIPPPL